MLKIRRALISVWDKKGIVEFARKLSLYNIEIISTGKTASLLRKANIKVIEVSSITSFAEILSGRVKTLHPKIFGGILANKKHPLHMEEIRPLGIEPIDMVVVNFYPFPEKIKEKLLFDEIMEYIDIGGPALLRAGAKNFKNVLCVSSINQYQDVIDELNQNKGFISEDTLRNFAREVFFLTKNYDAIIYNYLLGEEILSLDLKKQFSLCYGENPHQKAELYQPAFDSQPKFHQLQGKLLSFNNIMDFDIAYLSVKNLTYPAASIIKHSSLCGLATADKLYKAYRKAYLVDSLSSFGGIIGLNRKVDKLTAQAIIKSGFKEGVIAPSFSKEALRILSRKKKMRLLEVNEKSLLSGRQLRSSSFGYLIQDNDEITVDKNKLKIVTKRKPTEREMKDLLFAFSVAKYTRSNAIAIVKNLSVLGIGGGQPSRVGAVEIALKNVKRSLKGAVLASDGFFPKEDAIRLAHRKGISAIIQPGGSICDEDIFKLCDNLKIAMVITGLRHFRH